MDMKTTETDKTECYIYSALQYPSTALTPKGYKFYVLETRLSFKVLAGQAPHSKSKSLNKKRGAQ